MTLKRPILHLHGMLAPGRYLAFKQGIPQLEALFDSCFFEDEACQATMTPDGKHPILKIAGYDGSCAMIVVPEVIGKKLCDDIAPWAILDSPEHYIEFLEDTANARRFLLLHKNPTDFKYHFVCSAH